jgi:TonB family protein
MSKLRSVRCIFTAALSGCFFVIPCATSQAVPGGRPAADANALLLAAATANGAPGPEARPWHAKFAFTLNDWSGKPELQGTVEEFWAAPDKVKLVYATSSFNQVEYRTASGIRRTGSRDTAPPEITHILDQFLQPIPLDANAIGALKLQQHEVALGAAKLTCISPAIGKSSVGKSALESIYCISGDSPILRLIVGNLGWQRTVRNSIIRFQGRYIPQTIERLWPAHTPDDKVEHVELHATLDSIEALSAVDETQFTPPPDALPPPEVITLDEEATKPQLLQHAPPVYPPIAKAARVSGDVVLELQVQTDGRVSRANVISGPAMLQQSALDGIRKWTYRPFIQNGEPVEVNTVATVKFRIF